MQTAAKAMHHRYITVSKGERAFILETCVGREGGGAERGSIRIQHHTQLSKTNRDTDCPSMSLSCLFMSSSPRTFLGSPMAADGDLFPGASCSNNPFLSATSLVPEAFFQQRQTCFQTTSDVFAAAGSKRHLDPFMQSALRNRPSVGGATDLRRSVRSATDGQCRRNRTCDLLPNKRPTCFQTTSDMFPNNVRRACCS